VKSIIDGSASRREFLKRTGILLTSTAVISAIAGSVQAKSQNENEQMGIKISPPEDLMREHGVLRRILLIYENIEGCLDKGKTFPLETLSSAAEIIQNFIENYHEKLEEAYVFPRLEKAGKLVDLVTILRQQHKAGRHLTEFIKKSSEATALQETAKRMELAEKLRLFIRMYRPHAAREDTILFPAFRSIVTTQEIYSLGEEFEDKEISLLGEGGFEGIVAKVASLEKPLGIYELAQFTPAK
jgi:hemerythrin-like domain-containing protein